MERTDTTAFGIALVGHVALVVALKFLLDQSGALTPPPPMEVSFVEEVAMVSSAPASDAAPAPAIGEEAGPIEQASGAEAAAAEPEPQAAPEPTPPRPETTDRRRADLTRSPVVNRPLPRPPVRAANPRQNPPRPQPQTRPAQQGQGQAQRSRGSVLDRLSREFGRGSPSSQGKSQAPQGAVVTAQVRANLDQALLRALLPCQRQTLPAEDARAIRVRVAVTLNPDGSLASARVASVNSYDSSLRRYEQRMREIALNVVRQCAPIRGLPSQYYSVARGWRQFNYTFPRA